MPFVLGTLSFPSPVDRKFLVCTSDVLTNKSVIYSGAKSFRPLYTIIHVWYCTRYGNGSHFNSVNMCRDGVIISTSRMILAARFCNFNSLRVFPLEHLQLVSHWHANFSRLFCEFCRGLSHDIRASVARVS